jgi:hypothetical protein
MERRTHWIFSVIFFPKDNDIAIESFEIDPKVVKAIYEHRFYGRPSDCPMEHLKRFNEKCKTLNVRNTNNNIIKVELFPYSLGGKALDWIYKWPPLNFSYWFNFQVSFVERFGSSEVVSHIREIITSFKQNKDGLLVNAWERFSGLAYGTESGFKDWMLIYLFYNGLVSTCRMYLDNQGGGIFMNLTTQYYFVMLEGFLI